MLKHDRGPRTILLAGAGAVALATVAAMLLKLKTTISLMMMVLWGRRLIYSVSPSNIDNGWLLAVLGVVVSVLFYLVVGGLILLVFRKQSERIRLFACAAWAGLWLACLLFLFPMRESF